MLRNVCEYPFVRRRLGRERPKGPDEVFVRRHPDDSLVMHKLELVLVVGNMFDEELRNILAEGWA